MAMAVEPVKRAGSYLSVLIVVLHLSQSLARDGLDVNVLNKPAPPVFPTSFEVRELKETLAEVVQDAAKSLSNDYASRLVSHQCLNSILIATQVSYNFSLPYEKTVQRDGLVYPVRVWRDADRGVSRMDTLGGRNIVINTKASAVPIHASAVGCHQPIVGVRRSGQEYHVRCCSPAGYGSRDHPTARQTRVPSQ